MNHDTNPKEFNRLFLSTIGPCLKLLLLLLTEDMEHWVSLAVGPATLRGVI